MTSFLKISKKNLPFLLATGVCVLFFIAYSTLSIVRHTHYESFGFDLGINDQTVWRYSRFELPLTTIAPFPDRTKLANHVELIYALVAPLYWIWPARKMLLLASAFAICAGGLGAYLLAQRKLKNQFISFAIMLSYLMFYGVQNAVWFDVHSSDFAAAFLMWFIYFLDNKRVFPTFLFLFLSITAKENVASYTLVIALLYLIRRRTLTIVSIIAISILYLIFIYIIYFPHIVALPYLYANKAGILSNLNPLYLINSKEKLTTLFYSFASFGFIPFLNPLTLALIFVHFTTFFVIASDLPGAQGLYGHYRVTLAPLFVWSTVITIATFKFLNRKIIGVYLIICIFLIQYTLHLPLSYLTKKWFWNEPPAINSINEVIVRYLPLDASVVSQNNITPHISHRDKIYTLYTRSKHFASQSPCQKSDCPWFEWFGSPDYLLVDVSSHWDARHLLTDPPIFLSALKSAEVTGRIKLIRKIGTTRLYRIEKK